MGSVLDKAKQDLRNYLGKDWETTLTITDNLDNEVEITGYAFVHSQGYDSDGRPIITENSHLLISESDLTDEGLVVRSNGRVVIENWRVSFSQSGVNFYCVMSEPEPDTTLGVIKVQVSSYE